MISRNSIRQTAFQCASGAAIYAKLAFAQGALKIHKRVGPILVPYGTKFEL